MERIYFNEANGKIKPMELYIHDFVKYIVYCKHIALHIAGIKQITSYCDLILNFKKGRGLIIFWYSVSDESKAFKRFIIRSAKEIRPFPQAKIELVWSRDENKTSKIRKKWAFSEFFAVIWMQAQNLRVNFFQSYVLWAVTSKSDWVSCIRS